MVKNTTDKWGRLYGLPGNNSWILTHEAFYDRGAFGAVYGRIYWAGGNYWVLVEDWEHNEKGLYANSFDGLFTSDPNHCRWFSREDYKPVEPKILQVLWKNGRKIVRHI